MTGTGIPDGGYDIVRGGVCISWRMLEDIASHLAGEVGSARSGRPGCHIIWSLHTIMGRGRLGHGSEAIRRAGGRSDAILVYLGR
jgi:hypothetical protein